MYFNSISSGFQSVLKQIHVILGFFLAKVLFSYSFVRYSCSETRRFKVEESKETTAHKSNNIPVVTHSSFYRQIKREAWPFRSTHRPSLQQIFKWSDTGLEPPKIRSNLFSSRCLELKGNQKHAQKQQQFTLVEGFRNEEVKLSHQQTLVHH